MSIEMTVSVDGKNPQPTILILEGACVQLRCASRETLILAFRQQGLANVRALPVDLLS